MNMDDIDTPVDEALLMGDEPQDEPEEEQEAEQPEGEAPDEPEGEEGEPEEKDEAPKEKPESDLIPKWRFNEINEERKALRAELEALKAQQQREPEPERAPAPDVRSLRDKESDLESQLESAMLDGDDDKRKAVRAELRTVRDQIDTAIRSEAEARAEMRLSERMEREAHQRLAVELEAKYPVLSDKGDPAAVEMVLELRDAYIAKGMTPTKALRSAADKVLPLFASKQPEVKPDTEDPRKAQAIRKGAETNNATPPRGSGVGNRAQAPREDINSISQGKWEKMTPAEREKLLAAE